MHIYGRRRQTDFWTGCNKRDRGDDGWFRVAHETTVALERRVLESTAIRAQNHIVVLVGRSQIWLPGMGFHTVMNLERYPKV